VHADADSLEPAGTMTLRSYSSLRAMQRNWFFLAAVVVVVGDVSFVALDNGASPRLAEIALLIDLAVIVPLMHLWCYRQVLRLALIRALALSCLAVWAVGYIVPQEHHRVLESVRWLRYAGLIVLMTIEIKLVLMLWRIVFASVGTTEDTVRKVASDSGMPHWLAGLFTLEALFWRKVWRYMKRVGGRFRGRRRT